MPALRETDSKKWINALLAVGALVFVNIVIRLLYQISEWTDMEAKIDNFRLLAQIFGLVMGLVAFVVVLKNQRAYQYLSEVYAELIKVVWPDKDSTIKLTVVIVIGVAIAAIFLGLIDFGIGKLLGLLY